LLLEIEEQQGFALVLGQAVEGGFQQVAGFLAFEGFHRAGLEVVAEALAEGGGILRQAVAVGALAVPAVAEIPHDGAQPGPELLRAAQGVEVLEGQEERVLRDVL
jgi:hypothetical protein